MFQMHVHTFNVHELIIQCTANAMAIETKQKMKEYQDKHTCSACTYIIQYIYNQLYIDCMKSTHCVSNGKFHDCSHENQSITDYYHHKPRIE